jgi:hypothetical protein
MGEVLHRPSPTPSICVRCGRGCGWLGPPLSFVLANTQVGGGSKGQTLQTTILYASYVLSSAFPGLYTSNLISPHSFGVSCIPFPLTLGPISSWQSYTQKVVYLIDHRECPSFTINVQYNQNLSIKMNLTCSLQQVTYCFWRVQRASCREVVIAIRFY